MQLVLVFADLVAAALGVFELRRVVGNNEAVAAGLVVEWVEQILAAAALSVQPIGVENAIAARSVVDPLAFIASSDRRDAQTDYVSINY